jgi:hypothetical protein
LQRTDIIAPFPPLNLTRKGGGDCFSEKNSETA